MVSKWLDTKELQSNLNTPDENFHLCSDIILGVKDVMALTKLWKKLIYLAKQRSITWLLRKSTAARKLSFAKVSEPCSKILFFALRIIIYHQLIHYWCSFYHRFFRQILESKTGILKYCFSNPTSIPPWLLTNPQTKNHLWYFLKKKWPGKNR